MDDLVILQKAIPEYNISHFADKLFYVKKNNCFVSWINTTKYDLKINNNISLIKNIIENTRKLHSNTNYNMLVIANIEHVNVINFILQNYDNTMKILIVCSNNAHQSQLTTNLISKNIEITNEQDVNKLINYYTNNLYLSINKQVVFLSNMNVYSGFFKVVSAMLNYNDNVQHTEYYIIDNANKKYSARSHDTNKVHCSTKYYFQKIKDVHLIKKYPGIKYYYSQNRLMMFDQNVDNLINNEGFDVDEIDQINNLQYIQKNKTPEIQFNFSNENFGEQSNDKYIKMESNKINILQSPIVIVKKNIEILNTNENMTLKEKLLLLSGKSV